MVESVTAPLAFGIVVVVIAVMAVVRAIKRRKEAVAASREGDEERDTTRWRRAG
jgi:hypothetical protein